MAHDVHVGAAADGPVEQRDEEHREAVGGGRGVTGLVDEGDGQVGGRGVVQPKRTLQEPFNPTSNGGQLDFARSSTHTIATHPPVVRACAWS